MTVRPYGRTVLMGGLDVGLELPYRHFMRNCITMRGQWMYPREAPGRIVALVRAGLLSLRNWQVDDFDLDRANEAVAHAAASGGPFKLTVLRP